MKFKGDTGILRQVLADNGLRPDMFIFNDKRVNYRRLKVWGNFSNTELCCKLMMACEKAYGSRFICAGPILSDGLGHGRGAVMFTVRLEVRD